MRSVVIAGGGLIGLVVAWRAAQRGFAVTVVDESPGTGASYAAAGMLAPVTEVAYGEEALLALSRESLARYPAFAAELLAATGLDVGLRTSRHGRGRVRRRRHAGAGRDARVPARARAGRAPPGRPRRPGPRARAVAAGARWGARAGGPLGGRSRPCTPRCCPPGPRGRGDAGAGPGVLRAGARRPGGRAASVRRVLGRGRHRGAGPGRVGRRAARGPGGRRSGRSRGRSCGCAARPGWSTGTVRALVRGRPVYLVPYDKDGLIVGRHCGGARVRPDGDRRRRARPAARRHRGGARGDRAGAGRDAGPVAPRNPGQRPAARPRRAARAGARHRPLPQRRAAGPGRPATRSPSCWSPGRCRRRPRRSAPTVSIAGPRSGPRSAQVSVDSES